MASPTNTNYSTVPTPSAAIHVGFDLSKPLPGHIDSSTALTLVLDYICQTGALFKPDTQGQDPERNKTLFGKFSVLNWYFNRQTRRITQNVWKQLKGPTLENTKRLFGIIDFQPVIQDISRTLRFTTLPNGKGGDNIHSVVANAVSARMLSYLYEELTRINRAKAQTTDPKILFSLESDEYICLACIEASKVNNGPENNLPFFNSNEFRNLERGSEGESIANIKALVEKTAREGFVTYRETLYPETRKYLDENFPLEPPKEEEMDLGINCGEALARLDDALRKQFPTAEASGKLPITVAHFATMQESVTKTHYDEVLGHCWGSLFDPINELLPGEGLPFKRLSDHLPSQLLLPSSIEYTAWINWIRATLSNPDYAIALSKITSIDLTHYSMPIFPTEVAKALTGLRKVLINNTQHRLKQSLEFAAMPGVTIEVINIG
jgi:hypothetical protein